MIDLAPLVSQGLSLRQVTPTGFDVFKGAGVTISRPHLTVFRGKTTGPMPRKESFLSLYPAVVSCSKV